MNEIQELKRLQKLAEKQKEEKAHLKGQMKILIDDMKELGVSSPKAAKAESEKLNKQIKERESTVQKLITSFKRKYAKYI